jgi:anti-sigma regulatory factor (Ser/Thr protein kinase)
VAPVDTVEREFDGTPESVRGARLFVASALAAWHLDDVAEVVVLLTSEVATNAVRHARTAFRVSLELRPPEILVKVRDGSRAVPQIQEPPLDAEGGRGLPMVRILSSRWGCTTTADGKLVWFAVPTAA